MAIFFQLNPLLTFLGQMETEVLIQGSGSEESCQRLQIYSHLIQPKWNWP